MKTEASKIKYVACCSFGKDSLAQIIVGMQHNEPIDLVIYSEVMFTDEISGEYPEHRDFIYNVAIPKLKELYGLETVVLRSNKTMWEDFHTVRVRGENAGKLRGFPIPGLCNINRDCKIPPIKSYIKLLGDDVVQYIGIASDEKERLKRLDGVRKVSLLDKYGITEQMATDICREAGLLSPIYDFTKRNGCFFCPNSRDNELRHLYHNHKDLWGILREMQKEPNTSRRYFTRSKTIFDYEEQFQNEERSKTVVNKLSYTHYMRIASKLKNGSSLCGGLLFERIRIALCYYFKENGGYINDQDYVSMTNPCDLYIVTGSHKRDVLKWKKELPRFLLTTDPEVAYYKDMKVVIDSWNNIKKYSEVNNAFFIFDDDLRTEHDEWVEPFMKITEQNKWIILTENFKSESEQILVDI